MPKETHTAEHLSCYCALCRSRCGAIADLEDGRFVALNPDPRHPTGKALCAKGRAAPELVYHQERLLYPLKRTRPKGDPDPGWQRISWEEALTLTANNLKRFAAEDGPQSVVFSAASPSTTAIDDSAKWIERLMRAYGSPNLCSAMELCGWGRFLAPVYTFGTSVPGNYMPDLERAGCILYWGFNPNLAWLSQATNTMAARRRGARMIVVDPRRTGIAKKADIWLQVRPGSDGALALAMTQVMIANDWYDRHFVREWTNGPLLVRADNGRLLRAANLFPGASDEQFTAWNEAEGRPVLYDPAAGTYDNDPEKLALMGEYLVDTSQGRLACRPVFDHVAALCERYAPEKAEAICGVSQDEIRNAARLLWESRPVAYYTWSGIEMQSNATQIVRAIAQLYTMTGSFDAPGGNVLFQPVPTRNVVSEGLPPMGRDIRALGLSKRPLGPSRWHHVTSDELYRGIVDHDPYKVRGLVGFGANLLLSHADGKRGRNALSKLDFYVHADLFMNPTAELADVVLPVTSPFESEGLKIGFEISQEAQSFVQLRQRVVEPRGDARSDMEIVFDLATRLGLGDYFWDGDIEAAYRYQLGPSGVTVDELRKNPGGVQTGLETHYRKYSEAANGTARGFHTPTRKIELYSEAMLAHGYGPLPDYEEPLVSPSSRPDLVQRYPMILTCAKNTVFCESQHRALPSLRSKSRDPEVEMHPAAADERGIEEGDWVTIETPQGSVRARARFDELLDPGVVCGQHGWWQACTEIGAPGYDPFGAEGANFNLIIGNSAIDPVSGSVPHRAYLCQIRPAA